MRLSHPPRKPSWPRWLLCHLCTIALVALTAFISQGQAALREGVTRADPRESLPKESAATLSAALKQLYGQTTFPQNTKDWAVEHDVAWLYRKHRFRPFWVKKNSSPCWRTWRARMEQADDEGLNPHDYQEAWSLSPGIKTSQKSSQKLRREITMTRALVRFVGDLYGRRSRSLLAGPHTVLPTTYLSHLLTLLENHPACSSVLSFGPRHPHYLRLRSHLHQALRLTSTPDLKLAIHRIMNEAPVPLNPQRTPLAQDLRRAFKTVLQSLGVWNSTVHNEPEPRDDTEPLQRALKQLQHILGLTPDGIWGMHTRAQLLAIVDRQPRLIATLERWRHAPTQDPKGRHAIVNLPGRTLKMMDGRRVMMDLPLIVGRPNTPTPLFDAAITAITFHPSWIMPPGMVQGLIQQAQKNPDILKNKGLNVHREGKPVDASEVDWGDVARQPRSYRFWQAPGPKNALGTIRFTLNPSPNIHLHGTPEEHLFDEDNAFQSAGCLRLSQPAILAHVLLAERVSATRLDRWLRGSSTVGIPLKPIVPISVRYQTAWVNRDGTLSVYPDIYGWDKVLLTTIGDAPEESRDLSLERSLP